jgi:hypothetical protein
MVKGGRCSDLMPEEDDSESGCRWAALDRPSIRPTQLSVITVGHVLAQPMTRAGPQNPMLILEKHICVRR